MSKKRTAATPTPAKYSALWVYGGQRMTTDGKMMHVWYSVTSDGVDESQSHLFAKNIVRYLNIGDLYIVRSDKEDLSSIYTGGTNAPTRDDSRAPVNAIGGSLRARVDEWALREQADKTEHERRALVKKTGRDKLLSMTLQELSDFARTQLPDRRRALAAYVLSKLALS